MQCVIYVFDISTKRFIVKLGVSAKYGEITFGSFQNLHKMRHLTHLFKNDTIVNALGYHERIIKLILKRVSNKIFK